MGFYARHVVPRLVDLGMRQKRLLPLRAELAGEAQGRVLEVGIGSGLNLPFYRRDLALVYGIDPSPQLLELARRKAAWVHFDVRLVEASAEAIPAEDASFDCALMTWTLCSIAEPAAALAELRRVLRPGGRLLFVEHGRADDGPLACWQDRLTPLWRPLAGGCHLNRDMAALVSGAGFALEALERGHLVPGPRLFTYLFKGTARRR